MTKLRSMREADLGGKDVILRADFNVPVSGGKVSSKKRIIEAIPTINYLLDKNARITVISHMGRPKGADISLSLLPVLYELSSLTGRKVKFLENLEEAEKSKTAKESELSLLENIRFYEEEEKNDEAFAKRLSGLGSIFVSDAFGVLHRAHASTTGIGKHIPAYAGFLVEKELQYAEKLLENIERPYIIVMGGSKISDKMGVLKRFLEIGDNVLVGGALANSLILAGGHAIGASKYDSLELAKSILKDKNADKLRLPTDFFVLDEDGNKRTANMDDVKEDESILDVGPKTADEFSKIIKASKTSVFNGPMGLIEDERFRSGTLALCGAFKEAGGTKIACGGDTASIVEALGQEDSFSYISTGGGAFLELLEGKELPGIEILGEH